MSIGEDFFAEMEREGRTKSLLGVVEARFGAITDRLRISRRRVMAPTFASGFLGGLYGGDSKGTRRLILG